MDTRPFTLLWKVRNFLLASESCETFGFLADNLSDVLYTCLFVSQVLSDEVRLRIKFKPDSPTDNIPSGLSISSSLVRVDAAVGDDDEFPGELEELYSVRSVLSRRELYNYLLNGDATIKLVLRSTQLSMTCVNARTTGKSRHFSRVWTLTNFNQMNKIIIFHEKFDREEGCERLEICVSTERAPIGKVIKIEFVRCCFYRQSMSMNAKITVLDAQGHASEMWKMGQNFFNRKSPEVWVFPTFINQNSVLKQRRMYLVDNTLRLKCEFTINSGRVTSQLVRSWYEKAEDVPSISNFAEDMNKVFDDERTANVKLNASGETVDAHSLLLTLRSKKFSELLDTGTKKCVLDLPDLDMVTLKRMLKFMYTDEMEDVENDAAEKSYIAAHTYGVEALMCKYSFFLATLISTNSVSRIVCLAHDFHDQDLEMAAVDFIVENWERVALTEGWKRLSEERELLAEEIMWQVLRQTELRIRFP